MAEEKQPDPRSIQFYLRGLAEANSSFAAEPAEKTDLAAMALVWRQVLDAYGHRCAVTGEEGAEPVPIRPRPDGGTLHVSNFICLSPLAEAAFRSGALAVGAGQDYALLVNLALIDHELLEALSANLIKPTPDSVWPDEDALRWHRVHVFLSDAS